jgi:hypothetical protein
VNARKHDLVHAVDEHGADALVALIVVVLVLVFVRVVVAVRAAGVCPALGLGSGCSGSTAGDGQTSQQES